MHAELIVLEVVLALEHQPLASNAASELRAHRNPAQQRRHGESAKQGLCKAETMRKAGAHLMSPHHGCMLITDFLAVAAVPPEWQLSSLHAAWHEAAPRDSVARGCQSLYIVLGHPPAACNCLRSALGRARRGRGHHLR